MVPRVVVLGSINTDLTLPLPRLPVPGETSIGGDLHRGHGGKGANQAVAASRAGAAVTLLAAVGDDDLGRDALDHYRRQGIDVTHVRIIPGVPSGAALIFVGEGGENMIGVAAGANARLTPEDLDHLPATVFAREAVFLAGFESPIATVARGLERARQLGMPTILNPAPAHPDLLRGGLLHLVDLLTPNRVEAEILSGMRIDGPETAILAAEAIREAGARAVVVTLGALGFVAATAAETIRGAAFPVAAVDTVGAGDAFNGSLAAAVAEGRTLKIALRRASAAASLSVMTLGAQAGMPRRDQIDRLAMPSGRPDPAEDRS